MTILLVVFLFQSGLAYAFSYFVCLMVIGEPENFHQTRSILLKVRTGVVFLAIIFPSALFLAFWFSLPDDRPVTMAALPALWLFMIITSVGVAITRALAKARTEAEALSSL